MGTGNKCLPNTGKCRQEPKEEAAGRYGAAAGTQPQAFRTESERAPQWEAGGTGLEQCVCVGRNARGYEPATVSLLGKAISLAKTPTYINPEGCAFHLRAFECLFLNISVSSVEGFDKAKLRTAWGAISHPLRV